MTVMPKFLTVPLISKMPTPEPVENKFAPVMRNVPELIIPSLVKTPIEPPNVPPLTEIASPV